MAFVAAAQGAQTENLGMRALPAPGRVLVDGKTGDWDLSGGIFACDDVETQRDNYATWLHAMHDADNFYVLARWADPTPMNNPGQTIADYGFAGDCLQFRTITRPGTPQERCLHFTCWKGSDGADVVYVERGIDFKEGIIKDAKQTEGVRQAFAVDADGKGYTQEMAIPWKLLTRDGLPLRAGDSFALTFEPNFTLGPKGRFTVKDLFKPGVTPDRIFTFMSHSCWGAVALEPEGAVKPQPVRLADGRELAVKMEKGIPVVDWTGLAKNQERPGFIPIAFTMPFDGCISLNIKDAAGQVVRQLLNADTFSKGPHIVKWDGLSTWSWNKPGEPVASGSYTWSALVHKGIGLKLRGWACNDGSAPWDSADGRGNWGGDHGIPCAVAADDQQVYLGWSAAEAGKAVLACDLQGRVLWGNNRGGISGCKALAAHAGVLYVLGGLSGNDAASDAIYKLNAKDGSYLKWLGTGEADLQIKTIWPEEAKVKPAKVDAIAVRDGKLYLSFTKDNLVAVLDGESGKLIHRMTRTAPGAFAALNSFDIALCGIGSNGKTVTADFGQSVFPPLTTLSIAAVTNAVAIAADRSGNIYVGTGEPEHQVRVYSHFDLDSSGSKWDLRKTMGVPGGRRPIGPWQADGFRSISAMAIDAEGKLWVAEADGFPKRMSVWDPKTGQVLKEFFGPTSYGALGGAICPTDPNVMAGQGCEWRIDPQTGRARCTAVITRDGMENARFVVGSNGRVYLAVAGNWEFNTGPLKIYERLGDAKYALRTVIYYGGTDGREWAPTGHGQTGKAALTMIWSDANGDGERQPEEISGADGELRFSSWYMNVTPDFSLYCKSNQFRLAGFTACGAPKFDLSAPVKMPLAGLGGADGRAVLRGGDYGETHTWFACADIASGRTLWTYPDNFNGVHGSHNACPPVAGMIRGSYGPCGAVKLPKPAGNAWVIASNVGEWHLLTESGFYLARLFEGDPMKVQWPEHAAPGADMSRCPPGMGAEDFGGSVSQGLDGRLYIQAGKTAYWNLEVTGLDTVEEIAGKTVAVSSEDIAKAQDIRDRQLQAAGVRRMTALRATPKFTGSIEQDFASAQIIQFEKTRETAIRSAAAWDGVNLYLAWDVLDRTPWANGAEQPEQLYLSGDTVDFQLGLDARADPKRDKAVLDDLRLSIGNFKGAATAVLYRPIAAAKHPKTFGSGVVKEYTVDCVEVLESAQIKVAKRADGYVVEAAIPLASLGLKPVEGLRLRGDFGATFGDPAGKRTRLRSHWSNRHTGITDDAVFELMLEPKNWGELIFK